MNKADWTEYRRKKLQKVAEAIEPELLAVEALMFEEVAIPEVAELHQRFRDFLHEFKTIRAKYKA